MVACSKRLTSKDAFFTMPFTKHGLVKATYSMGRPVRDMMTCQGEAGIPPASHTRQDQCVQSSLGRCLKPVCRLL